jgi:2-C-methyl-D-erythritol 4-phosphate cytidylyltransferase
VAWCLDAFAAAESIGRIVIVAPPGHEAELAALAADAVVVTGAEARSASVAAGLERVETELVAVHDAARPLVTAELIDRVVERLAGEPVASAALAATPVTDTLKRAEGDPPVVRTTEDREGLWAAQTPQVFRAESLRDAHAADPARTAAATDDAMLVELAGGTVLIEPAPASNLKVTISEDLRLAEALLR